MIVPSSAITVTAKKSGRLLIFPNAGVFVYINDLAQCVFPQVNHRKAIRTKAQAAHSRGEVYRVPPMADDIVVPINNAPDMLAKWCHRDARAVLAAFDFNAWKKCAYANLAQAALMKQTEYDRRIAELETMRGLWRDRQTHYAAQAEGNAADNTDNAVDNADIARL